MFLVDSHCHLDYEPMADDIEGTLRRAKNKGISGFLTICTDLFKIPDILTIAESHPEIFATVGVHPHEAEKIPAETILFEILTKEADSSKVVGFGETGLDYYYSHSSPQDQTKAFISHIEAGLDKDLPLIVHTRDAEKETIDLIKTIGQGKARGVLHCFSGTSWLRDQALDLGFYISVSGIITFKKAEELRVVLKDVPLDRLLVETDSPYLAPEPYRGKPNEPAFMIETVKKLAELKEIGYEKLCTETTQNFLTLFSKVHFS
ncbi:MAG: TatD family hydrolase [Alphaproteobacteria bacterium]|nr:TatD family hydrolase [Alphaproteobacteria bacterium]